MSRRRNGSTPSLHPLVFDTIRLEGALFTPDLLEKICLGDGPFQSREDYAVPKGLQLSSEYGRAFHIAKAQWAEFSASFGKDAADSGVRTRRYVRDFFRDVLGYPNVREANGPITLSGMRYPVPLLLDGIDGRLPAAVAPYGSALDAFSRDFGVEGGGRRKTPFQMLQEFLNACEAARWGVAVNGRSLRLLRSSRSLTRPCFLEFDLERIMEEVRYPDFKALWLVLHYSRSGLADGTSPVWERWRERGREEGARVRENLRDGVSRALLCLGNGFLSHPDNVALRAALSVGTVSARDFYAELLRLIYRILFVITLEERELLRIKGASEESLRMYASAYSFKRLRDRSLRGVESHRPSDLWYAVRVVFRGLAFGEPRLALPQLGGLFSVEQCPRLDTASLSNRNLLLAIRGLRWAETGGGLTPVDYRNMGPEELGSVYESLLEYEPKVELHAPDGRKFQLPGLGTEEASVGNARKTTGSYYTPDSLVGALVKSALEPVMERIVRENPSRPAEALMEMSVIDPSCGSGHFLLAAARRIAERVTALSSADGAVGPEAYRGVLRDVVARCIYGVDLNPLAVELARFALWLEGDEPGRSLAFVDHHIKCGNALLGLLDADPVCRGIPQDAFTPLSGDDKALCSALKKENKAALKRIEGIDGGQGMLFDGRLWHTWFERGHRIDAMPDGTLDEVERKRSEYEAERGLRRISTLGTAANLYVGAFLVPREGKERRSPTSSALYALLEGMLDEPELSTRIEAARLACTEASVFHWFVEFPEVMGGDQGGFDCVLGNPPWEVSQLSEEEFFASRDPNIAALAGNERKKAIAALEDKNPPLWNVYLGAKRNFESSNQFCRSTERFSLTATGKLNTYALFAETMSRILAPRGRAGLIVPTGIATDDSTKAFFSALVRCGRLASLYDFENREKIFPGIDSRIKFCLLTIGAAEGQGEQDEQNEQNEQKNAEFAFFLTDAGQLEERDRRFALTGRDFAAINPNTGTCPVFRSRRDAALTRAVYARVPVLIREARDGEPEANPWGVVLRQGLFNMTSDSHLFEPSGGPGFLPLYEAKMIHQFDHRWAGYVAEVGEPVCCDVPEERKNDPGFAVIPRYWVSEREVLERLARATGLDPEADDAELRARCPRWLMGWRDICRATDERTVIASVLPRAGVGDTLLLMFPGHYRHFLYAGLLADQNSLVHDFIARQKIGGTHLKYHVKKQICVLPPDAYTSSDVAFILPRVLELTYTSHALRPWAEDICPEYSGGPFPFDPDRRAVLRAELDAYYARLYRLTRDDLRYILDPHDVMGPDYPSETFRVLRDGELARFGEYRTRRLVLESWDRLNS